MADMSHGGARWVLASTVGLAVGIPGGLLLGAPLEVIVGAMLVTPLMLGLTGLLVGGSQWLALKDRIPGAVRWIGLTALGFAVGFTIAVVLVEQGGERLTGEPMRLATAGTLALAASLVVMGVIGGGTVGLAQSLAVRGVEGATRTWTTASAAGLTVGFLVGMGLATAVGGIGSAPGLVLFLLSSGAVYAAMTGRALRRILAAGTAPH